MIRHRTKNGFSLLELSVVLTVIALVAGGVMVGKDMIRQSGVRSIMTDVQKVKGAVDTFRETYQALPGDMPNATNIWGTAAVCPPTADFQGPATCNGNGNGMLLINDIAASVAPEWFYAWQHLANAKLIEGSYTGRPGAGGVRQAVPGVNVMAGKMRGTGFTLDTELIVVENNTSFWSGNYMLLLFFGTQTSGHTFGYTLTPEEAYRIDEKMDDGKPGLGIVRAYKDAAIPATGQECITPNGATTLPEKFSATYERDRSARSCRIFFSLSGDPG